MIRERSRTLYEGAKEFMPGGVSSPIRAFRPFPSFISSASGKAMWDVDGNQYTDYCLGYGPLIAGHAHPAIVDAIQEQAGRGTLYGSPSEPELSLCKEIVRRVPCADMVRLTNSGTESTMHAIRLARAYTGKETIVKIRGGFHGSHDSVLVEAGSGLMDLSIPGCPGVPAHVAEKTVLVEFNDEDAILSLLESRDDIAAVIMEPVLANTGTVIPEGGYLRSVRRMTEKESVIMIMDEVVTGMRLSGGGAQESFGVTPDLCTLGKIIGGGLPCGALAGRRDMMESLAPQGDVYQGGTFSGNPLTAAAGLAMLGILDRQAYSELGRMSDMLICGLKDIADDMDGPACANGTTGMAQIFLGRDTVRSGGDAKGCDAERYRRVSLGLLEKGIFIPPSQFETLFISTVHGKDDIEMLIEELGSVLKEVGPSE